MRNSKRSLKTAVTFFTLILLPLMLYADAPPPDVRAYSSAMDTLTVAPSDAARNSAAAPPTDTAAPALVDSVRDSPQDSLAVDTTAISRSARTAADPVAAPSVDSPATFSEGAVGRGIWVGIDELQTLPTRGPAWDRLVADARRDPGRADIADQDSNHDVYTMAAALVCVRIGEYCAKARQGILEAIGTEQDTRWLAVGRNLGAYVIAADLLDLRADGDPFSAGTRVERWIQGWLTKHLRDNNRDRMRPFGPFRSGANAAAQEGFVYAAVAAYLGDGAAMERAWDAFRTFACEPGAPDREGINLAPIVRDGWTHDDSRPCAVSPRGAAKSAPSVDGDGDGGGMHRVDGALNADMRRGGTYRGQPGYTQYPWVGLEGFVPAAVILDRSGYPAFEIADRAVLRTHEYLWDLRSRTGDARWFDGVRARAIVQIVNSVYGTSFPVVDVVGRGRTVGYTDWTHR